MYNYNFSYRNNYSLAAALASKVTSVKFRQMDEFLPFYSLVTPLEVAILEIDQVPGYNYTWTGNFAVICCKQFNEDTGRWSSQGILNSGRIEYFDYTELPWHICLTFEPASLSIIRVENPTAFIPLYQPTLLVLELANFDQNTLCPFFVVFFHILLLIFLSVKYILREAEDWKQREIAALTLERQISNYSAGGLNPPAANSLSEVPSRKLRSRPYFDFPVPILLHSKILAGQHQNDNSIFAMSFDKSFGRWHYLYTYFRKEEVDVGFVNRSLSFVSLTLLTFSINCTFLSHIDMTTANWYYSLFKTALVLSPLAQVFPWMFRTILHSQKSNTFKPELRHGLQSARVSPEDVTILQSSSSALGKSRLKYLKFMLGEEVITTIKENSTMEIPISLFDYKSSLSNTNQSYDESNLRIQSLQIDSVTPKAAFEGHKIAQGDQETVILVQKHESSKKKTGSLQFFLENQKSLEKHSSSDTSAVHPNDNAGSASFSAESEDCQNAEGKAKSIPLNFRRSLPGSVSSTNTEFVEHTTTNVVIASGRRFGSSGASIQYTSKYEADVENIEQRIDPDINFGSDPLILSQESNSVSNIHAELIPPPPPPRNSEPPPNPPPGKPPVKLGKAGERKFWRSLRISELEREAPFFESDFRKLLLRNLIRMGDSDWTVASRQRVPSFLPRKYLYYAYIVWILWVITCFVIIATYSVHYDNEIGSMWILSSILSLSIELLFTQTFLSAIYAWWTSSLGKPKLIHILHSWASERADLLPALG